MPLPIRLLAVLFAAVAPCFGQVPGWHALSPPPSPTVAAWHEAAQLLYLIGPSTGQRMWQWDGANLYERQGALTGQPPIRHLHYDPLHGRLVALAEANASEYRIGAFANGSWLWRWGPGGPTPAPAHATAFDTHRGRLVVYDGAAGRVHEWDGQQWWLAASSNLPSLRTGGAFAYDPARQCCVLYGGLHGGQPMADCWRWDGLAWQLQANAAAPGPRVDAAMGFDPTTGSLLLHGGSVDSTTWQWTGGPWQSLGSAVDAPAQARHRILPAAAGAILVPAARELAGGNADPLLTIQQRQAGSWQTIAHFPELGTRPWFASAFDPVRQQLVTFGGSTTDRDQTRLFDGWWRTPTQTNGPVGRIGTALAWSAHEQRIVMFGGTVLTGRAADTWSWDGMAWQAASPATSPPARAGHVLVGDPSGGVLLFGGRSAHNQLLDDQWLWDGTTWLQQLPGTRPAPREFAAAAHDPDRNTVILWGGIGAAMTWNDTWLWDGSQWTAWYATLPTSTRGTMTFDHLDRRIKIDNGSLHEWTGTSWQAIGFGVGHGLGQDARLIGTSNPARLYIVHPPHLMVRTPGLATATSYGNGCGNALAPSLAALGRAALGATMQFEVACSTAHTLCFLLVGLGPIQPLGVPPCTPMLTAHLGVQWRSADAAGLARFPFAVPATPALRGLQFAAQGAAFEPHQSPIGSVTTTRGLRVTVGD